MTARTTGTARPTWSDASRPLDSVYPEIKWLHVLCVTASACLFLLRGWWMWRSPERMQRRWVRVLPHVIDTALFATGITLVIITAMYPWQQPWLAVKLVALVVYILLGMTALRFARDRAVGRIAWVLAVMTFLYMVVLALTKSLTLTTAPAVS